MGKVGIITGGLGDIVYTIPLCRLLNVTVMYVKENFYHPGEGSMYTAVKPLLESQGIKCRPTSGAYPFDQFEPGIQYDINFDAWRMRGQRDRVHIIKNMMLHYRCYTPHWNRPFLFGVQESNKYPRPYNLIFLTERWREGSAVNWPDVLRRHGLTDKNTFFIGLMSDWEAFMRECPDARIQWNPTNDLLEMASLIAGCNWLFCNQGVALTIAQGLSKNYWLEKKPAKTNTLFYTIHENIL